MSSSRKVSVSLACVPDRLRPGAAGGAGDHDALDDEPVRRLDEEDLAHPALVDERPDRAEDLLEVLARASLVDPHRVSSVRRRAAPDVVPSRGSGAGGLVEQPAILRSAVARPEDGDRRECSHRPGRQQGEDDLRGARARRSPVRLVRSEPGPPIAVTPPGNRARRTPSIHHVSGVSRPIAWTGPGRTDSGKTTPETRNSAPAAASGYDHDSWRVCMQIAASSRPIARIDVDAERPSRRRAAASRPGPGRTGRRGGRRRRRA